MRMGRGAGASVGGGGLGRHSGLTVCNMIYQQVHWGPLSTSTVALWATCVFVARATRTMDMGIYVQACARSAPRARMMPRRCAGQAAGFGNLVLPPLPPPNEQRYGYSAQRA